MANSFVKNYQGQMAFAIGLYKKYLEICPQDVWREKFGGWPVAQQIYHALAATVMFMASITGKMPENPAPTLGDLNNRAETPAPREQAARLLANIETALEEMFADLSDEDLLKKNDQASQMLGRDTSNAAVIELMTCHLQYHLGSCDAALRQRGLEGAF